ncbi:hypothetical protein DB347_24400, partial [Opitutaceae bacterium EW11]
MIGIFDSAHFHDASLVPEDQKWSYPDGPADPNDPWYSLICEKVKGEHDVFTIPYGCVMRWDGG